MKYFRKIRVFYFVYIFIAIGLLAGCASTGEYNRDLKLKASERIRTIKQVTVLPVNSTVVLQQFAGDPKTLPEKEISARNIISHTIRNFIEERGFAVADLGGDQDDIVSEMRFEMQKINDLYQKIGKEKPEDDQQLRSIGPVVNGISSMTGSDALIVSTYQGVVKTGGEIAKEIVASTLLAVLTGVAIIPAKQSGVLEIALIDGVTGDILWSKSSGGMQDPGKLASTVLEDLPSSEGYEIQPEDTEDNGEDYDE